MRDKTYLPLIAFVVIAILTFIFVQLAHAQDSGPLPDKLPPTAAQSVEILAVFLAALSGLLATAVTDAIKRLPFLSQGDKSKLTGPMADLVAAVVSIVSGYVIVYATPLAAFLDQSGLWQVLLFSWPMAKGWFEVSQRRRLMAARK